MRRQLASAAGWLLIVAILAQHGSSVEALNDAEEGPLDGISRMLGEAPAAPLQEQNTQLLGAISAIEGGTPPAGMEAMMGGGEAAAGGEAAEGGSAAAGGAAAGGAAAGGEKGGNSAAISDGIKMAMKSVKPLMDKYVATARALTNKYTLLKKRYKTVKAKADAAPTEEDVKGRIQTAVDAEKTAASAKLKTETTKLQKKIAQMQGNTGEKIQALEVQVTKLKEFSKNTQEKFKVELSQAKEKAKSEVHALHEKLKAMMLAELKKRDEAIELKQKKENKERDEKAKAKEEASVKEAAAKKAHTLKETKEKEKERQEANERKAKQDAAEEIKILNRKTVMRKARLAVSEARAAGRMARKISHDADTTLENARLDKARKVTEDDVKALSKLRHHEDLAVTAIDSAREKRNKIGKYEYEAKRSLTRSQHRMSVVKKKERWELRRVSTLKDLATRARDKAKKLKSLAVASADNAGLATPRIELPPDVSGSVEAKISAAHAQREKAREDLQRAGVPIPAELQPGAMSKLNKEVTSAEVSTQMKPPGSPASPSSTDEGHAQRDNIRKQSAVENALQKAKIARSKLDTAKVKRQIARDALKSEGKPVPDTLRKGGLAAEEEKLAAAAAKAKSAAENLEKEEEGSDSGKAQLAKKALKKVQAARVERKEAREDLEKEGKPIPSSLAKGGMDKDEEEAKEEVEQADSISKPSAGDSEKTASVKKQALAREAGLKADTAMAKVTLARTMRKKARQALKSESKDVPAELGRKALDETENRAKAAIEAAKKLKGAAAAAATKAGVAGDSE